MKGLRLFLPPFAPDTAGAASVLYPLGGLVVIVDAGGCAGNICGFDEPRFSLSDHASVFTSAALRDMDAILGRDEHLIAHIDQAIAGFAAVGRTFPFLALVGTPVPAVIGTDLHALARIIEQHHHIPSIAIDTDGTEAYDIGIEKTYATLFRRLARIPSSVTPRPGTLGVLGATTLDYGADAETTLGNALRTNAKSLRLYGLSHDVTHYIDAAQNERNLVIAPSGLRAAQWLQKTFGTPYDIADPLAASVLPHLTLPRTAKNILILHHQITANTLRTHLQRHYPDALITCATYFRQIGAITKPQDLKLREESDLPALITEKHYDLILGDPLYKRTIPACSGTWIPLPHPAVSGF
ncbi:MAG: hypothetical protein MR711_00070 [Selenomonas sp.]|uniref:nitrogenase component 1 n=1 Tax=Selenomonas sp. TaxID=2053611 RepID=UPI0025FCFB50|nr:nitrogenase component 1 [Selenomonas sp.]MCI6084646.1 hypothetical protein [Selenomonas sp.]MDY4417132.1 nitrogenase component 1 [Selenomonas sp.]